MHQQRPRISQLNKYAKFYGDKRTCSDRINLFSDVSIKTREGRNLLNCITCGFFFCRMQVVWRIKWIEIFMAYQKTSQFERIRCYFRFSTDQIYKSDLALKQLAHFKIKLTIFSKIVGVVKNFYFGNLKYKCTFAIWEKLSIFWTFQLPLREFAVISNSQQIEYTNLILNWNNWHTLKKTDNIFSNSWCCENLVVCRPEI